MTSTALPLPLLHSYDTLVDCCHMYLTARSAALSVVQEEIDKQTVDSVSSNASATLSLSSASSEIYKLDGEQVTSSYNPAPDINKNESKKEKRGEEEEEENKSTYPLICNINETARPLKRGMDDTTVGSKRARPATSTLAPTRACGGNTSLVADTVDAVMYANDTYSKESKFQSQSLSQPLQKYQNGSLKSRNVTAMATHAWDSASLSESTALKDRHRGSVQIDSATHIPSAICGEDESSVSMNLSDTQNSNGSQETVDLGSVDVAECADMHDISVQCSLRVKAEAEAEAEAKAEDKKLGSSRLVSTSVCPAAPAPLFLPSSCLPGMSSIHPSFLLSCLPGMSTTPSSLPLSCLPGMSSIPSSLL